jgi:cysteine desulfurase
MRFSRFLRQKKRIYLDYAAATPVRPEVYLAMQPYFSNVYGNPSAIHTEGVLARTALERARKDIARMLHIRTEDVVFTGNGTESNNLAILGTVEASINAGKKHEDLEIISTRIEHPSVLETLKVLENKGVTIRYVSVTEGGCINTTDVQSALSEKTILVTYAHVNSEIGVIQDVKRISRMVKKYNTDTGATIKIHLDASQSPLWVPVELDSLGVDLLTLDAGKCYGPKGVGVLAYRHGVTLTSQLHGGDQEHGLRAGTENVALAVGCAVALLRAESGRESRVRSVTKLRDAFIARLEDEIEGVIVNGSRDYRAANNVNISIPGIDSEYAVVVLDKAGIAASTKSACSGASGGGSTVVLEIGNDSERAASTIRFTLGEETTMKDIKKTVTVLKTHVEKMRTFQNTME